MEFASVLQPGNPPRRAGVSASEPALKGRVVVLTGAAGFLGRRYAETLSLAGAHVILGDIRETAAQDTCRYLSGEEGMAVGVDITSPPSVSAMMHRVIEKFGRIDGLVNNAGIDSKFDAAHAVDPACDFENFPLEGWRESIDVNLTGALLCTQAAGPFLRSSGRGTVVNISSIYGIVGPDQRLYQTEDGRQRGFKSVAYAVTKSAVLGFTRYLAAYWGSEGVRVNALTLGGAEAGHDAEFVRRYSARTPLGRMARRDEYGGALVFLLSDASSYMTGANLVVDGGWTAW